MAQGWEKPAAPTTDLSGCAKKHPAIGFAGCSDPFLGPGDRFAQFNGGAPLSGRSDLDAAC